MSLLVLGFYASLRMNNRSYIKAGSIVTLRFKKNSGITSKFLTQVNFYTGAFMTESPFLNVHFVSFLSLSCFSKYKEWKA